MNFKNLVLLVFTALLLCCVSCSKSDELLQDSPKTGQAGNYSDDEIVLGKEINDPYRLENMQAAFKELKYSNPPINEIAPNHKYVRIKPANEEQLDLLQQDTNLLLWSYPLNYELLVNGTYYHDPSIPKDEITFQYCVVPMEYEFPSELTVEHIYDVFIPPMGEHHDFYSALEDKAYEIIGIKDEPNGSKASEWTPSATIRAYDDVADAYVPLQGIIVRARYGTKTAKATTNSSGFCQMTETFKHAVNYSFKWERAYWDIRNGVVGQAFYNGPQLSTTWNLNISKTAGKSILYATVHRAALKFYYGNTLGVTRPILSTGKTKIGVMDSSPSWGSGCCWGTWSFTGAIPDIVVAHPHETTPTDMVFNTTIHELAHQSHLIFMNLSTYIQLAKEIHESWADAVAWRLTAHHYQSDLYAYTGGNYSGVNSTTYNNQDWEPGTMPNGKSYCYTPLFIDLMDNYNQRTSSNNNNRPNDNISGYTLEYIQNNILVSSYGLSSFRDALRAHKINGVTDNDISQLMELYWGYEYTR